MPDRFSVKPATLVGLRQGYLKVPAFSAITGTWKGASEVFKQFNFSAEKAFVLPHIPKQLDNLNYALTIKYRVGSQVYRYKLWDNLNLLPQVEQYINQVIKPNFCLEFWSFEGLNETSISEKVFPLGIKVPPTDLRETSGVQATTDAEEAVLEAEILADFDWDRIVCWYKADDLSNTDPQDWPAHNVGTTLVQDGGSLILNKEFIVRPSTQFYTNSIQCTDATDCLVSQNDLFNAIDHLYIVFKVFPATPYNAVYLVSDTRTPGPYLTVAATVMNNDLHMGLRWNNDTINEVVSVGYSSLDEATDFHILELTTDYESYNNVDYQHRYFRLYKPDGTLLFSRDYLKPKVLWAGKLIVSVLGPGCACAISEILAFDPVWDGAANRATILKYLTQIYHKGTHIRFPELHPSVMWKDNPEEVSKLELEYKDLTVKPADAFKDVIYLRNTADGKYYPVTLTTVNGVTTVNVGNSPVEGVL